MTKIKLCGMWRPEDIEAVNMVLPEYTGFVFWEKSRRYVTKEVARELKDKLDKRVSAVGVFLDAEIKDIVELAEAGTIDMIQLHGHEDESYIKALRDYTDKPVIKAFVIKEKSLAQKTLSEAVMSSAEHILIDSGAGSGETCDWSLLKDIKRPYFLAGGLDLSNISEAIEALDPFAVDVSSGIETDKKKDADKMRKFVDAVRVAKDI